MKTQLNILFLAFLFSGCSLTIDTQEVITKYRQLPIKDGVRAAIIEDEILPEFHKEAPHQLNAIAYAKRCFMQAQNTQEANLCTKKIVATFGDEFAFHKFNVWDKKMKSKMMDFLNHNKESLECYMKAEKADDIIPCKDPVEPNF
jgi:hypothetical protein